MSHFNSDNWDATEDQMEIANGAFDEAWGAIEGFYQRHGSEFDAEQTRSSLGDAINNAFDDEIGCAALAEAALVRMGFTPVRSIYSLECK